MDIGIISMRYAKTLLRFAHTTGEAESVYADMQAVAESFKKVPALQEALLNPVITAVQKRNLLESAASAGNSKASETTKKFFELVTKNHREDLMQFIAHSYTDLYTKSKNIIRGRLVLPAPISEDTRTKLHQMAEKRTDGKTIEFSTIVNPEIEGGFILEYDTYRLDASLRTQMREIRRSLTV